MLILVDGRLSTLSSQESFRSARDARPHDFQALLEFVPCLARNKTHIYRGAKGRPVSASACARWTARKVSAWFRFTMSTCHSRIRRKASGSLLD
jgi:hypothetical protein